MALLSKAINKLLSFHFLHWQGPSVYVSIAATGRSKFADKRLCAVGNLMEFLSGKNDPR